MKGVVLPKYVIHINERTLDLVMFLSDGHKPEIQEDNTYLVCEINGPREITSKIETSESLRSEDYAQETMIYIDNS
jgi:hypothetical protein